MCNIYLLKGFLAALTWLEHRCSVSAMLWDQTSRYRTRSYLYQSTARSIWLEVETEGAFACYYLATSICMRVVLCTLKGEINVARI